MKRCFNCSFILFWLLLPGIYSKGQIVATTQKTFSSPNAKTDVNTSYRNMLYLDYSKLFTLGADLSGGIIGNINAGGRIKLEVYSFDDQQPNGKGSLVYGVYTDASSSGYAGIAWEKIIHVFVDPDASVFHPITANSDDVKALVQKANIFVPDRWGEADCKSYALSASNALTGGYKVLYSAVNLLTFGHPSALGFHNIPLECSEYFQAIQPVIVEVTLDHATFYKMKIPGMGEFDASDLFSSSKPIAAIGGKVTLGSHRGDWQGIKSPENTKNSILDMIAENYDMIELDLWETADSSIIVFHDMGLGKRTVDTGNIKLRSWNSIKNLYIKNRFDEVIQTDSTKIELLSAILDFIKQQDPQGKIWLNLDRSANDIRMFRNVYKIVETAGMLDRAIFKGRIEPTANANGIMPAKEGIAATPASIRQAFADMYPSLTQMQRDNKMRLMHYTPILFDNKKNIADSTTNDAAFAVKVKQFIDDMIGAGIADGFELNYKSYPVGSPDFANATNDNVFLLIKWPVLGNDMNFVQYIHSKGLPVGIFASVPEACAIPDYDSLGNRIPSSLVSGFIKEDYDRHYIPKITQQGSFDFRGDWDFYIPAGADYVITDRPDALREYLKAIGRFY